MKQIVQHKSNDHGIYIATFNVNNYDSLILVIQVSSQWFVAEYMKFQLVLDPLHVCNHMIYFLMTQKLNRERFSIVKWKFIWMIWFKLKQIVSF